MKFNEDYLIESESVLNVVVKKKVEVKPIEGKPAPSEEVYKSIAFFPSFPMAVEWIVQRELNGCGFTDLESVNSKIKAITKNIKELTLEIDSYKRAVTKLMNEVQNTIEDIGIKYGDDNTMMEHYETLNGLLEDTVLADKRIR